MKKILLALSVSLLALFATFLMVAPPSVLAATSGFAFGRTAATADTDALEASAVSVGEELYRELGLDGQVAFDAFESAFEAFNNTSERRREVLTLIDFTKPSTDRRLWVIDMDARKVLFNSVVAHGQGSGGTYATSFSNRNGSHQSSLGTFLTAETYNGRNGYSLTLDGLDPGVNDNARARAVVVHGSKYAEESVIPRTGRLGRSWGCPAIPASISKPVIDAIKGGSVLYIYGKS